MPYIFLSQKVVLNLTGTSITSTLLVLIPDDTGHPKIAVQGKLAEGNVFPFFQSVLQIQKGM